MAQSVKHSTLDFGSGHDLTFGGMEPYVRLCTDSMEPAWDSILSLSFPLSLPYSLSLALKINKTLKKKRKPRSGH